MEQLIKYFPDLTEEQLRLYSMMKPLYSEWNEKINVISRKDMDEFYLHHVIHSLAIARSFKPDNGSTVLDIGTGGGFPGIPLAIFFPKVSFVLCDSIGKKIKVANAVASSLGLNNVKCINCRAEEIDEKFDWVVSRAVTRMDNFLPWVMDKYTKGIIYLKGGEVEEELIRCRDKCGLQLKKVTIIDINEWFREEWFDEKKIIIISR